jgi:hypothetical protein
MSRRLRFRWPFSAPKSPRNQGVRLPACIRSWLAISVLFLASTAAVYAAERVSIRATVTDPSPPRPSSTPAPRTNDAGGGCVRTGCSGHICAAEHVISTCEWLPEYACWRLARCALVPDATQPSGASCAFQVEPGDETHRCLLAHRECVFDEDCPQGSVCGDRSRWREEWLDRRPQVGVVGSWTGACVAASDLAAPPTATATPTPPPVTSAPRSITCPGDCDGDHRVRVNELVRGVGIALDQINVRECRQLDMDDNERITVDELVTATNSALMGCLPDLLATSATNLPCPGGCAPARVEICVANQGSRDATSFSVSLNGTMVAQLASLASDAETCLISGYRFGGNGDRAVVRVDASNTVEESNEGNNELTFPAPNPTACDVICGPDRGLP